MNAKEVLEYAKKNNVTMVDLRFTDWPGTWQHCSYPIEMIEEDVFEDGMGFDGSSIRGWQAINESDMLMVPDPSTAFIDPFFKHPTLVMIQRVVMRIRTRPVMTVRVTPTTTARPVMRLMTQRRTHLPLTGRPATISRPTRIRCTCNNCSG